MVTLTADAVNVIRDLTQQVDGPAGTGLRIARQGDGALHLHMAEAPEPGDAVVDVSGARLFLDEGAERSLDGKALDAGSAPDGQLQFIVGDIPA